MLSALPLNCRWQVRVKHRHTIRNIIQHTAETYNSEVPAIGRYLAFLAKKAKKISRSYNCRGHETFNKKSPYEPISVKVVLCISNTSTTSLDSSPQCCYLYLPPCKQETRGHLECRNSDSTYGLTGASSTACRLWTWNVQQKSWQRKKRCQDSTSLNYKFPATTVSRLLAPFSWLRKNPLSKLDEWQDLVMFSEDKGYYA